MAIKRYSVTLTDDVVGSLNPAVVDITVSDPVITEAEMAARMIGYMSSWQWYFGRQAVTRPQGVAVRTEPAGATTPIPFPTTEYAALISAFNTFAGTTVLAAIAGYGSAFAGVATTSSPSGRGDSVCFNTRASAGGRSGRGRHFIPFLTRGAVDTDGLLSPISTATMLTFYQWFFQGVGTGAPADAAPVVYSRVLGGAHPVDILSINTVPSRLRSRTK